MKKRFANILLLVFCSLFSYGQNKYKLEIFPSGENSAFPSEYKLEKNYPDSVSRKTELLKIINKLQTRGYIAAYFDSLKVKGDTMQAFLNTGEQYQWMELRKGNTDASILTAIGYREKHFRKKIFQISGLEKLFQDILGYCENHGYPFAAVQLDSILIFNNIVTASLHLELNKLISIDTIVLISKKEEEVISSRYMQSYIGIKKHDFYKESKILAIDNRLRELPFLNEWRPAEVIFGDSKTKLNLFIEKKNANQFDGLIGFLPDNSGKLHFNGQVHLKLLNAFKNGELIDFNAQALPSQTSDLNIRTTYPFLLKSPFGIDLGFIIHKQDTSYLDIIQDLGIQYLLSGGNYIKVFVNNKSSSLISTSAYKNSTVLPAFADVHAILYGLTYKYEFLDYKLNPRKGFVGNLTIAAGTKEIKRNTDIDAKAYEGLRLHTNQYKIDIGLELYRPLSSRNIFKLAVLSGTINSENTFKNELYRIGGIHDLRGFDDQSIYVSTFVIGNAEYRYILEKNSFFFAFFSPAWYQQSIHIEDHPFGFGSGVSFETKAGIFSVSYALGKQKNNPVNLQTGKIHFGIINYF